MDFLGLDELTEDHFVDGLWDAENGFYSVFSHPDLAINDINAYISVLPNRNSLYILVLLQSTSKSICYTW